MKIRRASCFKIILQHLHGASFRYLHPIPHSNSPAPAVFSKFTGHHQFQRRRPRTLGPNSFAKFSFIVAVQDFTRTPLLFHKKRFFACNSSYQRDVAATLKAAHPVGIGVDGLCLTQSAQRWRTLNGVRNSFSGRWDMIAAVGMKEDG